MKKEIKKVKKVKEVKLPETEIGVVGSLTPKPMITEIGEFGNQEMVNLVRKVNEIIRFINF